MSAVQVINCTAGIREPGGSQERGMEYNDQLLMNHSNASYAWSVCMTSPHLPHFPRYLREVGFPDNVLEARVDRISAYKNLYTYNQMEQSISQDESPKVS